MRLNAKYWASFVGVPGGRKTLFVGLYSVKHLEPLAQDEPLPHMEGVDKAGSCDAYELAADPRFKNLDGKLYIEWGDGTRSWIQRADSQSKRVIELIRGSDVPSFPGFLNLVTTLSELDAFHPEWIAIWTDPDLVGAGS